MARGGNALVPIDVVYEDNHVIAIVKPAGAASQPDRTGDPSIIDDVRDFLKTRDAKPGNVHLASLHRLDRPASGVLLLAKTSKAASRLAEAFRERRVTKTYLAVVEGSPAQDRARLEQHLKKDAARNTSRIVSANAAGAKFAALEYRVMARAANETLVEVTIETGRSHQIRVQLAGAGVPIAGDRRYGARRGFGPMIALHATRLRFGHPVRAEEIEVVAAIPARWRELFDASLLADAPIENAARIYPATPT